LSKKFLKSLIGDKKNRFAQYVATLKSDPQIAWEPSASSDLRDLEFLSFQFRERKLLPTQGIDFPDLFIHTDTKYVSTHEFSAEKHSVDVIDVLLISACGGFLINNEDKTIRVDFVERLPDIIVQGEEDPIPVLFMNITIKIKDFEPYSFPLLYIFTSDAVFLEHIAVPRMAKIHTVFKIRYSENDLGDRDGSGDFDISLSGFLPELGVEMFVTDDENNVDADYKKICEYTATEEYNKDFPISWWVK
jgi:hypothetical protein